MMHCWMLLLGQAIWAVLFRWHIHTQKQHSPVDFVFQHWKREENNREQEKERDSNEHYFTDFAIDCVQSCRNGLLQTKYKALNGPEAHTSYPQSGIALQLSILIGWLKRIKNKQSFPKGEKNRMGTHCFATPFSPTKQSHYDKVIWGMQLRYAHIMVCLIERTSMLWHCLSITGYPLLLCLPLISKYVNMFWKQFDKHSSIIELNSIVVCPTNELALSCTCCLCARRHHFGTPFVQCSD